jgi:hypothetical protein
VPLGVLAWPVNVSVPSPVVVSPPEVPVIEPAYVVAPDVLTLKLLLPSEIELPATPESCFTLWLALADATFSVAPDPVRLTPPLEPMPDAPEPRASVPALIVVGPV